MKKIYILLISTGSIPSKAVKIMTHYKYSHVALSLDKSFRKLYSFGRKKINNFLDGGFTTYGIDSDFYKKFDDSKCLVLEINVTKEKYNNLVKELHNFELNPGNYKYDFGSFLFRLIPFYDYSRKYYFVCSQFVASVLQNAEILSFNKPISRIKPKDFVKCVDLNKIYEGNMFDFNESIIKR